MDACVDRVALLSPCWKSTRCSYLLSRAPSPYFIRAAVATAQENLREAAPLVKYLLHKFDNLSLSSGPT